MRVQDTHDAIAEALLFAAGRPLSSRQIADVLGVDDDAVPDIMAALSRALEGRGLQVVEMAGGYQLSTRPEYVEYIRQLRAPEPERLSRAALETLTIVAYRQPITRPEVDAIRGVDSSSVLASLTEKGLIRITGRKAAPGRPLVFETTAHFLSCFGLKSLDELPTLDALRTAHARQAPLRQPEADAASGGPEPADEAGQEQGGD